MPSDISSKNEVYENLQYNFKINYPKGWKINEKGEFGSIVVFFNPNIDQKNNDFFSSNINIVIDDLKESNLEDYVISAKKGLQEFLNNWRLIEEKEVTLNNETIGYIIGGTFTQGNYYLRNLQLFVEKDGLVFILTGTTLESKWDKYKDIIETSLRSFCFLNNLD